jgi:hypothetical protein
MFYNIGHRANLGEGEGTKLGEKKELRERFARDKHASLLSYDENEFLPIHLKTFFTIFSQWQDSNP